MQEIQVQSLDKEDVKCYCLSFFLHMIFTSREHPWVWLISNFSCGSAGKEATCNVGDLGSIPGLGRSPREGNGYPLQYSSLENSIDIQSMELLRLGHEWVTFTSLEMKLWCELKIIVSEQLLLNIYIFPNMYVGNTSFLPIFLIILISCCFLLILKTQVHAKSLLSCADIFDHELQPTRPLCPWDFPSKNTGVDPLN